MMNQLISNYYQTADEVKAVCAAIQVERAKIQIARQKLENREKRVAAKEKKISDTSLSFGWMALVVEPLAKEIGAAYNLDAHVYGPMGIGCRVVIELEERTAHAEHEHRRKWSLTVRPNFTDRLFLEYETGETQSRYERNTLGEVNGLNQIVKPLPDTISEIWALFREDTER